MDGKWYLRGVPVRKRAARTGVQLQTMPADSSVTLRIQTGKASHVVSTILRSLIR